MVRVGDSVCMWEVCVWVCDHVKHSSEKVRPVGAVQMEILKIHMQWHHPTADRVHV